MSRRPVRSRTIRGRGRLSPDKSWYIRTGFYLDCPKSTFSCEEEARAAWAENKEIIMCQWQKEKRSGRRPWAWWKFGHGIDRSELGDDFFAQENYLISHGLLEDWEKEDVQEWRAKFTENK